MSQNITIEELSRELGNIPMVTLIEQLKIVGVNVINITDPVTPSQKQKLLNLLKTKAVSDDIPERISLKRRSSVSQIKVKSASGKNSTVNVVRKKRRVYVKQDILDDSETTEKLQDSIDKDSVAITEQNALNVSQTLQEVAKITTQNIDHNNLIKQDTKETTNKEQDTKDSKTTKSSKTKKDKSNIVPEEEKPTKKVKHKPTKDNQIPAKLNLNLIAIEEDNLEDEVVANTVERVVLTRKIKKSYKHDKATFQQEHNHRHNPHAFEKPTAPIKYKIEIPSNITVTDLAQKISVKSAVVIKILFKMGVMATINQIIDQDTACLVVEELGHTAILANAVDLENSIAIEYTGELKYRSPIVTVMGHVDHGKTSLLDYIRSTRVTAKEAGGITQHIGAYQVATNRGFITFLDTPGHSAFTAMRARGANCTDIVVLVVAADDSVKPQTVEAIQHAKAAGVPIIVAINKIDKPGIDLDKVISDLSQHNVMSEDWGGDSIFVKISAKTGEGIDNLLESIMLQAEMLELKAYYNGPAQGVVIESSLDKGRGIVATLLVQSGTLNNGDVILAGLEYGKIKTLKNDQGQSITMAGAGVPVEVLGLNGSPLAGDKFQVVVDERIAREIAAFRQEAIKIERLAQQNAVKFTGFIDKMQNINSLKIINIVLKGDVQGSVEAISDVLEKLSTDAVKINVIGKSVGGFNESDVNLALASKAFLLGFNVRAEAQARILAKAQGTDFNYYSVIYDLIDAVKELIDGSTIVPVKEKIIGTAEVREVFRSSKFGTIAGCLVKEGLIKRGNPVRVLRDNVVIYSGELESLRRFKENVSEVRNGTECGIGIKNYNDVKSKDQIEVFEIISATKTAKTGLELKR